MHELCAHTYVPVGPRDHRGPFDPGSRRRLARGLRRDGQTLRAIADALGVSARTIALDLAA
jgi:hypothetical protein